MTEKAWWKQNSSDEISAAIQEAFVDAYGEHEQFVGLLTRVQEELEFPFEAWLAGQPVVVQDAVHSKVDSLGIDFVCESSGETYEVAARSFDLKGELPEGQIFLAAYFDWKSRF